MIRFRRRADLQLRYASSPIRAIFPTPRKGERTHGHHESVTYVPRLNCYLSPRPVTLETRSQRVHRRSFPEHEELLDDPVRCAVHLGFHISGIELEQDRCMLHLAAILYVSYVD